MKKLISIRLEERYIKKIEEVKKDKTTKYCCYCGSALPVYEEYLK